MTATERADKVKFLDQDQVRQLFQAAKHFPTQDQLLLALVYRYGLRISEATGLKVDDLDLRRGAEAIRIRGLKGGHTRRFGIDPDLLPLVRRHKAPGAFLFASRQAGTLSRTQAWRTIKAIMAAAGVEGYGPHSLRHSIAVHMIDAKRSLVEVKDRLRHRSIRSTEIYGELSPGARQETADAMQRSTSIVKFR